MTDPWANRIPLNPRLDVKKDDQESINGSTQGTCEYPGYASDSAKYVDISNNFRTKAAPKNPPPDWSFDSPQPIF